MNEQKEQITSLRQLGFEYKRIAQTLDLSENTVKSFCRRQNNTIKKKETIQCEECGKPINISKRNGRRFCSDTCRTAWWNKHPKAETQYSVNCACCRKEIRMRRRNERKYCSHHCYITARYKDGRNNG